MGDLDNDRDFDLVFSNNHDSSAVLRNDSEIKGHWLQVELIGSRSNRNAIGSVMELETTQGPRLRMVKSGTSYMSTCDRRQVWGLAAGCKPSKLHIHWPSGFKQTLPIEEGTTYVRVHEQPGPNTSATARAD
jgi:hypothetical protein